MWPNFNKYESISQTQKDSFRRVQRTFQMHCLRKRFSRSNKTQSRLNSNTNSFISSECKSNESLLIIKSCYFTLQEHSYIHSGINDAYVCQFCGKAFRFGSSMYAHRKKAHPDEMSAMKFA